MLYEVNDRRVKSYSVLDSRGGKEEGREREREGGREGGREGV